MYNLSVLKVQKTYLVKINKLFMTVYGVTNKNNEKETNKKKQQLHILLHL